MKAVVWHAIGELVGLSTPSAEHMDAIVLYTHFNAREFGCLKVALELAR